MMCSHTMYVDDETKELLHDQPKLLAIVEAVVRHREGLANVLGGRAVGVVATPCEGKQR